MRFASGRIARIAIVVGPRRASAPRTVREFSRACVLGQLGRSIGGVLPRSVTGASYAAIWQKVSDIVASANGLEAIADPLPEPLAGSMVPRLSNQEAVVLISAWRRAAARGQVTWRLWYEQTIFGLGWRKDGDRFDMSAAHRAAPFPDYMLPLVWAWTALLAEDLDDQATVVKPLVIENSKATYERAAREAWDRMKLERNAPAGCPSADCVEVDGVCRRPVPGLPADRWPLCDAIDVQPQLPPTGRTPWWIWIVVGYGGYRLLGGKGPLG